ncbi:hypothetical protein [Streptomyces sp. NPDC059010]|uniref:hypothetical protein n=1 Tax=Streptomyces sp. NPDC059010 TaxID=3346695 RepID=UPI003695B88F
MLACISMLAGCGSSALKDLAKSGQAEDARKSVKQRMRDYAHRIEEGHPDLHVTVAETTDVCSGKGTPPVFDPDPPKNPDMSCYMRMYSYFTSGENTGAVLCRMAKDMKPIYPSDSAVTEACEGKSTGLHGVLDGKSIAFEWIPANKVAEGSGRLTGEYYEASASDPSDVDLEAAAKKHGGIFLLSDTRSYLSCTKVGDGDGSEDYSCTPSGA